VPALGPPDAAALDGAADATAGADVAAADDGAAEDADGAATEGAVLDAAAAGVFLLLEQAARSGLVNARVVAPKPAARKKLRRLMAA